MSDMPNRAPNPDRLAAARQALVDAERTAATSAPGTSSRTGGPAQRAAGVGGGVDHATDRGSASPSSSAGVPDGVDPDAYLEAKRVVLRQLAVAPRTHQQLADKLRQRGCDETASEAVLTRMTEAGLVDDEAFARMFVRSRQEYKGLASFAIARELREKGVDEQVISTVLTDLDTDTEKEKARELVAKKMRSMHGLERDVQVRRLAGLLARKGYDAGLAYQVVAEALDASVEYRRD